MKGFIFSVFLFAFISGNAQHTLSFNQAILVSSTQTVPAGAVWKVISIMPGSNSIANSAYDALPTAGNFSITVNSNPVYFSSVQSIGNTSNTYDLYEYTNFNGDGRLPMWLPAGTTLAASTNIQYISVIEFLVN